MSRKGIEKGTILSVGIAAIAIQLAGTSWAQSEEPVWKYDSDGSWVAETVSLGNEGTQVFAEYGAFVNARALFSGGDANPPTPVWTDDQNEFNFHRQVASSARGGVHAAMHQEFADANQVWKNAVLRKYSSDSSTPDWTYQFDLLIGNHNYSQVKISADGSRLVGAVYNSASMMAQVAVFDEQSGVPLNTYLINTFGAFDGFVVSDDGGTAVFRSSLKLVAIDLDSGALLLDQFLMNSTFYGGLDISEDGSLFAMGTGNTVVTYERTQSGSYAQQSSVALGAGSFSARLGVAADGNSLYYAVNNFSAPERVEVHGVHLASGETLLDYTAIGSGSYMNMASAVEVSSDGGRVAVGLWGDEGQTVPELLFFATGNNLPVSSYDAAGSIVSLDMSPAGDHVAVAARNAHATQFSSGGSIMLFESPRLDLFMDGVPTLGATVNLCQRVGASSIARVVVSPQLADNPTFYPSAGMLYVDRALMNWLPLGASNGAGEMVTPYDVPSDSAWIGTSLYFQGVGLAPRELSDNYVKLTVLP